MLEPEYIKNFIKKINRLLTMTVDKAERSYKNEDESVLFPHLLSCSVQEVLQVHICLTHFSQ